MNYCRRPILASTFFGNVALLATLATTVAPVAAASAPAASCEAEYITLSNASVGNEQRFVNSVKVTNLGPRLAKWSLTITLADSGQKILRAEPGTWTQTGPVVTIVPDNPLGRNESATLRFNGSTTGGNPPPKRYAINRMTCAASTPGLIQTRGTAEKGIEDGCMVLVPDSTPPGYYELVGGPRSIIVPGAHLLIYGYLLADSLSICMQGVMLRVASAQVLQAIPAPVLRTEPAPSTPSG